MVNEELANKTLQMEIKAGKLTAKLILKLLKKLLQEVEKAGGNLDKYLKSQANEVKLKDMVKKGQLEEINVKDEELKELKKELNRHGVKFSVMKDKTTGTHSVFFQAKDTTILNKAFKNVIDTLEKKEKTKDSIRKSIDKFKEMAKDVITKDKVKNKQKEQSL